MSMAGEIRRDHWPVGSDPVCIAACLHCDAEGLGREFELLFAGWIELETVDPDCDWIWFELLGVCPHCAAVQKSWR